MCKPVPNWLIKVVLSAPNWLIFWGLFSPLTVVDGIERLDKLYHYNDSPAANGRIKRTMSAVDFRDNTQA